MLIPILNTLFIPMMWTKRHMYSLDRLKKETCFLLNKLYNVDTFDYKDYAIKIHLFGGYQFYNKKTKQVIASSYRMSLDSIKVKVDNLGSFSNYNVADDSTLKEHVYFIHKKGRIEQISHQITVGPKKPNLADDEEVYKDIIIQRDKNYNVTSLMVETYDFTFMHGHQLDFKTYPNSYDIQKLILE